ncbi:MAG TPA: sigma-70 family RNA polymerase sigma factor [Mariniphaga sp.]|nr:sigma-70 family RNA polymerase sigma factor [Mariniphaga sp.]
MEENFLWQNIKKGDKDALKRLHNTYFHQMYLYAAKSIPDGNGLAEELVSDCFIKLWENRKQIEIRTSLKHYLFVILHNSIIDHYRKKRILTQPFVDDIQAPGDEKFFDDQKQYAKLYHAVKRLPEQCRLVLELAVFESLTYNEIAEHLHISRNTVKTQVGRAYRTLKNSLDPKDFNLFLFIRKKK